MALIPIGNPPISPAGFRATYGSTAIATAYQAVFNNWLDDTPTILAILDQVGKPKSFITTMDAMGFKNYVDSVEVTHYERPWIRTVLDVIAVTTPAGGAGNDMVISVTTINFAGANQSTPRENEVYLTHTDEWFYIPVGGINAAVNPNLITIRPGTAATDLDAEVFAGETYSIKSNAFPEAGRLIDTNIPRWQKYSNTFQITTESYGGTGTSETLATFTRYGGDDGPLLALDYDAVYRNEHEKSNAILWGNVFDNLTSTDTRLSGAQTVQGTEGIYRFYNDRGNDEIYTLGNFQLQDYENVDRYYITQAFSDVPLLWYEGHELARQKSTFLKEYATQYAYDYQVKIMGQLGISNGLKAFDKDGRVQLCMVATEFNDPRAGGGDGYPYKQNALVMPLGWNLAGEDVKGDEIPMVGHAYRAKDGYARENILVQIDGTGKFLSITNDEFDVFKIGYRSEYSAHATRANCGTIVSGV